jgi:hypothetical protein
MHRYLPHRNILYHTQPFPIAFIFTERFPIQSGAAKVVEN